MQKRTHIKNKIGHRLLFIGFLCLLGVCLTTSALPLNKISSIEEERAKDKQSPQKMKVTLLHADRTLQRENNRGVQVLEGNVEFLYDSIYMSCDTAYNYNERNYFEAFGNVKMNQGDTLFLYGDYLFYNGNERLVQVRENVRMENREVVLLTDSLNYDRNANLGYYFDGGTLMDSVNVLTSDWGEYDPETKMSVFNFDVVLENPQFRLISDTLRYNTENRIANIVGPSSIESDGSHIYSELGYYNTINRQAYLLERSILTYKNQDLTGDSIFYNEQLKYGEAFGNVEMNDTLNRVMLTGEYCYSNELTGYAFATDSAVAIDYSQGDSLYMHGDTLKAVTFFMDTDSMYREIQVYHKVRFYRTDVQGVCDSMIFSSADSCLTMYSDPILWNAGQQLLGEQIKIYMNDSTIDWAHIINQALTVEKKDSIHFNQVAGKEMKFFFKDKDIYKAEVVGNVQSIYYPEDEDSVMMGMNFIEASKLNLYRKDGKMERIVFINQPVGKFTPMFLIPENEMRLENFAWFDYMRPLNKKDIFHWRGKAAGTELRPTVSRPMPLPTLDKLKNK